QTCALSDLLEPTARLLADATRYQLAARVLREAPGPYPSLTRSFTDQVTGPDAGLDSPEPRSGLGPEAVLAGSGVGGDAARVPA
ncbi:hypothetical protein JTP77_027290, partial [Streptomyces sp. S9]|nr:hypothetical protein [Streptomyces sp. S9]